MLNINTYNYTTTTMYRSTKKEDGIAVAWFLICLCFVFFLITAAESPPGNDAGWTDEQWGTVERRDERRFKNDYWCGNNYSEDLYSILLLLVMITISTTISYYNYSLTIIRVPFFLKNLVLFYQG